MIDWLSVLNNMIWILALSAGLSVMGQAFWLARLRKEKYLLTLSQSPRQEGMLSAGLLFAVGRLLCAASCWEKVGWGLIALLVLVTLLSILYSWWGLHKSAQESEI